MFLPMVNIPLDCDGWIMTFDLDLKTIRFNMLRGVGILKELEI